MSANQPPEALVIIWPRLIAIADEMATTMFRTAFSHDVVEVHDMSTGLYDDRGCLIGQTWLGATGHTGVMPVYGRNLLEYFPAETVRPGDVYICNDPWICNGQTADVFITTPAFRGERLIGFSINSVHHVDIGGRKGSGLSEEVYEEGLIIPPLKLYDDGAPNEQLFAILRRNVRFAEKMIGDLRAQVAAGWAGSRALERLAAEFGLDSLRAHADEIMRRTEAGMRAEMETPVLYAARELIPDSGGAGEFRGGLGQELILQAYGGRVKEGRAARPVGLGGADALSPARAARRRSGRLVRGDRGERGGDCAFELAERDVPGG